MRIAQLVTQDRGGPVDHVFDLVPKLVLLGHEVCIIGPAQLQVRAASINGVIWRTCGIRSPTDVRGALRLASALRGWPPDVLHCQDRRAGLHGRLVGAALGLPTVYTLHGAPDGLAHLVGGNRRVTTERRRDRIIYLRLERSLARIGRSEVVVASAALGRYAVEEIGLPREAVHVVPNGIDLSRFSGQPRNTAACRVVWVGLMVPVKRLDLLLDAAALVPGLELVLVGEGPLWDQVCARIRRRELEDRVELVGFQPDPVPWLVESQLAVLSSDAENCPLSLIQAMAAGCAVVATSVGGVPELVEHDVDGLLVAPGDVEALAGALERLIRDDELRARMRAAARRRASDLDAGRMARRLVDVYEGVVSNI